MRCQVNILLDLDGTLTDPREGIVNCIRHALDRLDEPCPSDRELERFIGPPLQRSFALLLGTGSPKIAKAIALYRERYSSIGLLENKVYPGIPKALHELKELGATLYVATSKPTVFAERIIDHFGLARHIRTVFGSELDGTRSHKTDLIAHVLARESLPRNVTCMVGDREHDVEGAQANGVTAIGALWGYGSRMELIGAGAKILCESPEQLHGVMSVEVFRTRPRTAPDAALRAATASDVDFACTVVERSMRGYIEQTFGGYDAAAVRENAERMVATGTYAIIERNGEDIGVLHAERDPGDIWLASLFILPEHQGRGIGTRFVRELKAEAAKLRKPLRLRVLTINPAKRLYEREGFTTFTTTVGRTYMQWAPEGLAVPKHAGECPPEVRTVLDACGITPDLVAERYLVVQPEARELEVVAREESGREHRLAPAAARAWRAMQATATAEGIRLRIVSAFRTVERQREIIEAKLAQGQSIEDVVKVNAPPGYSEHHTGLAIDIGTDESEALEQAFEHTAAFAWLMANGVRFGFHLSYPRDNPYSYQYEPWHWCHSGRA